MDLCVYGIGGLGVASALPRFVRILQRDYLNVLSFESRGIAQRRGSVSFQLRSGDVVYSPQVAAGSADLVIAFEAMEALRDRSMIKKGTLCLLSDLCVNTFGGAQNGKHQYPKMDEIVNTITSLGGIPIVVPFNSLLEQEKLRKVFVSTALLAVFARMMQVSKTEFWRLFPEFANSKENRMVADWGFELFEFEKPQEAIQHESYAAQSVA